jgi:transposase
MFTKGRDFGAWLGIVPKQLSTGGRTILGKISKRGNSYLRTLFVQAARVVLIKRSNWLWLKTLDRGGSPKAAPQ